MTSHFLERSRIGTFFVMIAVILMAAGSVWAQEKRIIAVFDMQDKGSGLKSKVLSNLTDALWRHYETALMELLSQDLDPLADAQHTFDFDDYPPFPPVSG